MQIGEIRFRLAQKLQRDIPDIRGKPICWYAENLYRRQGRGYKFMDTYAWSGAAFWSDSGNLANMFDCWNTMKECLSAKRLIATENEIEIEGENGNDYPYRSN